MLAEAKAELREESESSGAVVESNNLPTVSGDRKQLVYLFRNLLSNAIKFQRPGVVPVIEITCGKRINAIGSYSGSYYKLHFRDSGIGFDEQYAERIFKVF